MFIAWPLSSCSRQTKPSICLGQPVHALDILDELAHARIIERIADPRDVELGEMAVAFRHAADSLGAQRAVFHNCAEAVAQSKA